MTRALSAFSLICFAAIATAEPPPEVLDLFRDAAQALVMSDADRFLDFFDHDMKNFGVLNEEIQGLVAANTVSSTVDLISDEGDAHKRSLQLDWLLVINEKSGRAAIKTTRRQVIQCTVERRGKSWKITSLEPVDFFRYQ